MDKEETPETIESLAQQFRDLYGGDTRQAAIAMMDAAKLRYQIVRSFAVVDRHSEKVDDDRPEIKTYVVDLESGRAGAFNVDFEEAVASLVCGNNGDHSYDSELKGVLSTSTSFLGLASSWLKLVPGQGKSKRTGL